MEIEFTKETAEAVRRIEEGLQTQRAEVQDLALDLLKAFEGYMKAYLDLLGAESLLRLTDGKSGLSVQFLISSGLGLYQRMLGSLAYGVEPVTFGALCEGLARLVTDLAQMPSYKITRE